MKLALAPVFELVILACLISLFISPEFKVFQDETAPTVASTSPVDDAEDVSRSTDVSVTFSEPMDATTINIETIKLRRDDLQSWVDGTVTYNSENYKATLSLTDDLKYDKSYTIIVTTGVKDSVGNPMATEYSGTTFAVEYRADITISSNTTWSSDKDYDVITVNSDVTLTLDDSSSSFDVKANEINVNGTILVDGDVKIYAKEINIGANGHISADGMGSAGSAGEAPGGDSISGEDGAGGGAHHGNGGNGESATNGGDADDYSTNYNLTEMFYYPNISVGSGGGAGSGTLTGGAGGGKIFIEVSDTLTMTSGSKITANGEDGTEGTFANINASGGGAGGGIFIFTEIFSGTGTIEANGGDGATGYIEGGLDSGSGGGGGLALITHSEDYLLSNLTSSVTAGHADIITMEGEDGSTEIKTDYPYSCQKCMGCCDPNSAEFACLDNVNVSLVDGCYTTEYNGTDLSFPDNVGTNFSLYYGSKNDVGQADSPFNTAGMTHSLNENLDIDTSKVPNEITMTLMCGKKIVYQELDTNVFTAPAWYGSVGQITKIVDSITYEHNNKIGEIAQLVNSTTYEHKNKRGDIKTFDSDGNWTSYKDANGNEMTLTHINGVLDKVEYPDGREIQLSYTSGALTSVAAFEDDGSTQIGDTISLGYTGSNFTSITEGSTTKWQFQYDVNGKLSKQTQIIDSSSSVTRETEFHCDSNGVVSQIDDEDGNTYCFSIDGTHRQTEVSDRNANVWKYNWNRIKRVKTAVENQLGKIWKYEYDYKRNLTKSTSPKYDSTNYTETVYTYDTNNNMTSVTVQNSGSSDYIYSKYTYDSYNNMIAKYGPYANAKTGTEFDKTKVEYIYKIDDQTGSGTISDSTVNINGTGTAFTTEITAGDTITVGTETRTVKTVTSDTALVLYTAFSTSFANQSYSINYQYDSKRNLRQIKRKLSANTYFITQYDYDNTGKVTIVYQHKDNANERKITYAYYDSSDYSSSLLGMLYTSTIENGANDIVTTYTYYAQGWVKQVTDPLGTISQYQYNDDGQIIASCSDVGGTGLELGSVYTYNDGGELTKVESGAYTSWSLATSSHVLDTTSTSSEWSSTEYQYDATGRLLATRGRNLDPTGTAQYLGTVYTYDDEGNTLKVMSGEIENFGASNASIKTTDSAYSQTEYEYNKDDSLATTTTKLNDTEDAVVTYAYYDNGSLNTVTGPEYDASDNMKSKYVYDFAGRTLESGQLITTTDVYNSTNYSITETTYNNYGEVTEVEDAEGNKTNYSYKDYTRLLDTVSVDQTTLDLETAYTYNDFGQVTKVTYANQEAGSEVYRFNVYADYTGWLTQSYTGDQDDETFANGINRSAYTYDKRGAITNKIIYDIEDADDVEIDYVYDALGRTSRYVLDQTGLDEGAVYTYDALSRIAEVYEVEFIDFDASDFDVDDVNDCTILRTSESEYDFAGRIQKSILNPVAANPTRLQDITTYYEYDELSRVIFVNDPEQWFDNSRAKNTDYNTQYVYDNASRLTEVKAQRGAGNLKTLSKYEYFTNGARSKMQYTQDGANWIDVDYEYNPAGWLDSVTYPGYTNDDEYTYEYYKTGVLKRVSVDNTERFEYTYDNAWRLTAIEEASTANAKQFTYNARSQVTQIKNSSDTSIFEYTYDAFGRLTTATDKTPNVFASGADVDYTYYKNGQLKELETPEYKLQYHYDNAMRVNQIDRYEGSIPSPAYKKIADYEYNRLGQRTDYTRYTLDGSYDPTSVVYTAYDYLDDIGWLQKVENKKSAGGDVISSFKYYDTAEGDKNDLVGNREYMEFSNNDYVNYVYDDLYQLTEEARYLSGDTKVYKNKWEYDFAGNRTVQEKYVKNAGDNTWIWDNYSEYIYNNANQLTELGVWDEDSKGTKLVQTDYAYDNYGNLTDKDVDDPYGASVESAWDYTYDVYNHLTAVSLNASSVASYTFNALGNRVQKYVNSGSITTRMLYDGANCVADYNENLDLLRYYVTPMLDENLILNESSADYYYLHDGLGSVKQIIDSSQTTQNDYDFQAFGSVNGSPTENITNRFKFTGRELDSETASANSTALYYYRARMYDSEIGQFISRDPVQYLNLYTYCANNPVVNKDSFGTQHSAGSWIGHKLILRAKPMVRPNANLKFSGKKRRTNLEKPLLSENCEYLNPNCCHTENKKVESVLFYHNDPSAPDNEEDGAKRNQWAQRLGGVSKPEEFIPDDPSSPDGPYTKCVHAHPVKYISEMLNILKTDYADKCKCVNFLTISSHGSSEDGEGGFSMGSNFDDRINSIGNVKGKSQFALFGEIVNGVMCEPCVINLMGCYSGANDNLIDMAVSSGCTVIGALGVFTRKARILNGEAFDLGKWFVKNGIRQFNPNGTITRFVDGQGNKLTSGGDIGNPNKGPGPEGTWKPVLTD